MFKTSVLTLSIILMTSAILHAFETEASWYSVESCKREGTSGITASGEKYDENDFTCASWDHVFSTLLLVINLDNQKSVIVRVNDRGPAKRLYRKGRKVDLSKRAFSQIADCKQGIIPVSVEVVK